MKNVAILGATGAVGLEMLKVLAERGFPIGELRLLASKKSVGREYIFRGEKLKVREATQDSFSGIDIVLGATKNDIAAALAPAIKAAGAVFIDNSSAFRLQNDVPLIIPQINPEDASWHSGIIANPNCSTIITLMALYSVNKLSPIQTLVASTYQAVSGAGIGGPMELENEVNALRNGESYAPSVFEHQIAYNLIPKIGSFTPNGYTTEEMKLQNEGRKILHAPDMRVSCTCVRVPVMRSHSISATFTTKDVLPLEKVREAIANAAGCCLVDDSMNYPMPLDSSDKDIVLVGRIRRDLIHENGISLWCCGDQVRKGAATNAIEIAELL